MIWVATACGSQDAADRYDGEGGDAIYGLLRGGSDLQPLTRGFVDRVLPAPSRATRRGYTAQIRGRVFIPTN